MVSIYWRSVTAHLARACESMGNITQWIIFSLFSEALSIAQWAISFCIGNPVTLAAAAAVTSEKFIVMHSLTAVPSDHVLLLLPINNHPSHCAHRWCFFFFRCGLDVGAHSGYFQSDSSLILQTADMMPFFSRGDDKCPPVELIPATAHLPITPVPISAHSLDRASHTGK